MVTLAKTIKRTPATNAEILKMARHAIERGTDCYICLAIEYVGRSHGSPKQIATLIDRVRGEIWPYAFYTQWAKANYPAMVSKPLRTWAKKGRLELIDRLILEVTNG
jgi:hypothetical protein